MAGGLDLRQQAFGRLVVVAFAGRLTSRRKRAWKCKCECGNSVVVTTDHLRSGHTSSCGCVQRERSVDHNTVHGKHGTAEYVVWKGMRERCRNPNHDQFENYGGRGICVCDRWSEFGMFLADMGPRPSANHSIERKDMNGNYEPSNCIWATAIEQGSNKRNNVFVSLGGEKVTLSEACRRLGIGYKAARRRFGLASRVQD